LGKLAKCCSRHQKAANAAAKQSGYLYVQGMGNVGFHSPSVYNVVERQTLCYMLVPVT
jgi:hypothetical protein